MTNDSEPIEDTVTPGKLARDIKVVIQDAEQLIRATAGELGDKLNEKTREARERLMASLESAKSSCHDLESRARAGVEATDKVIRDHPYESVGVAFGIGLVLGLLVTRR